MCLQVEQQDCPALGVAVYMHKLKQFVFSSWITI